MDIISRSDEEIIRAHAHYHYLSLKQTTRLLYSPGSFTYVAECTKRLIDKGFLVRLFMPRVGRFGNAPTITTLSRKGHQYLYMTDSSYALPYPFTSLRGA